MYYTVPVERPFEHSTGSHELSIEPKWPVRQTKICVFSNVSPRQHHSILGLKMLARTKPISTRRKGNCGGDVMIESVFTFIPMLALILIFADLGLMFFRWSTLQNAVRELSRPRARQGRMRLSKASFRNIPWASSRPATVPTWSPWITTARPAPIPRISTGGNIPETWLKSRCKA